MTIRLPITAAAAAAVVLMTGVPGVAPAAATVPTRVPAAQSLLPGGVNNDQPDCRHKGHARGAMVGKSPGTVRTWVVARVHHRTATPEAPSTSGGCPGLNDAKVAYLSSQWWFRAEIVRSRDGDGHLLPVPNPKSIELEVQYQFVTDVEVQTGSSTSNWWAVFAQVSGSGPSGGGEWGSSTSREFRPRTPAKTIFGDAREQSVCTVTLSRNRLKIIAACRGELPRAYVRYMAPSNAEGGIQTATVTVTMTVPQGPRRSSMAKTSVTMTSEPCGVLEKYYGQC